MQERTDGEDATEMQFASRVVGPSALSHENVDGGLRLGSPLSGMHSMTSLKRLG
jgi:hypothetical protein